jgi:hypothetical protein
MKTTIELAREANEYADTNWALWPGGNRWKEIRDERLVALARADEREACERDIEELLPDAGRADCAAAIRARGQA